MNDLSEEILMKYLAGECSDNDFVRISLWIKESKDNVRKLLRMEEIYHLGKRNPITDKKITEKAEERLYKRLAAEESQRRKTRSIRNWMKHAAIITIVLMTGSGVGYWYYHLQPEIEMIIASAPANAIREMVLPDGSKVWLNHSTTLKYPRNFSETERDVYLDGEAYFEVTKDKHKPFIVQNDAMRVRVLGTSFNFKCNPSEETAEASLIEGEIEVKGNHNEGMIVLSPGQKAELNTTTKRLCVKQVNTRMDAVWHNNMMPFDQANIYAIAKTLERFYKMEIIISPRVDTNKTYSGVLKKKKSIESVLKSLRNSIPIDYKIVGNKVFISSKYE